jgi:hypothetical protein
LKNAVSILLFGLLIFNTMGFSLYSILEDNKESLLYSESNSDEFVVKIPFSLPYAAHWQNEETAEGELALGTNYYDVVSQQLANDTVYLRCRYKESARDRFWQMVSTFDDRLSSANDQQRSDSNLLLKHLLKEYMVSDRKHIYFLMAWLLPQAYAQYHTPPPPVFYQGTLFSPPESGISLPC